MQSEQDASEEAPLPRRGFNVFLDKTHSASSVEVVEDSSDQSEEASEVVPAVQFPAESDEPSDV